MDNTRMITISTAGSRTAKQWTAERISWPEFTDRLKVPHRKGTESLAAYMRMTKAQQTELKDAGGFVGGTLRDGRRKAGDVTGRDLITLDMDAIPGGQTADVLDAVRGIGAAAVVYSTRKHCPEKPRLRVIFPMSRTVTGEEYEPIARRIAEDIGITNCDPTTFEPNRLMFWPTVCADGEYVFAVYHGTWISPDAVLATYRDWHDMRSWPQVPGTATKQATMAAKQEDPAQKEGIVGTWCRMYDVYRVMDELIPEAYTPCEGEVSELTGRPVRYTYTGGSTAGGAIVYGEGKWLYSHHGTDPCGGQLVNAWDLARLHLYGEKDANAAAGTPTARLPSTMAMKQRALECEAIRSEIVGHRPSAAEDFGGTPMEAGDRWKAQLMIDPSTLRVLPTTDNLLIILKNDPDLRGRIAFDAFAGQLTCRGKMPWDTAEPQDPEGRRAWTDNDDSGFRWYVERGYNVSNRAKTDDALSMIGEINRFDELKEYLEGLSWDGVPRVEELLIKYLLADDTTYTREVTRKTMIAAVARALDPGCKYDTVLTLAGGQGIGKSMFAAILGGKWFSDSVQTFEGKEAAEQLRNAWIVEIPEVDRFSNKEANIAKAFITRQDDIYRESYGRRTTRHPRRCVFIATVNPDEFLNDDTGGRRWWPVKCRATSERLGADFEGLRRDRDQIWAEAVTYYRLGESFTLDGEAAAAARQAQDEAQIREAWEGQILEFVQRRVPADWETRTPAQRLSWWGNEFGQQSEGDTVERSTICAVEVWAELFHGDPKAFDRRAALRINRVLKDMKGWRAERYRLIGYGQQRGYRKIDRSSPKEIFY